jgi:hypothetical protein
MKVSRSVMLSPTQVTNMGGQAPIYAVFQPSLCIRNSLVCVGGRVESVGGDGGTIFIVKVDLFK